MATVLGRLCPHRPLPGGDLHCTALSHSVRNGLVLGWCLGMRQESRAVCAGLHPCRGRGRVIIITIKALAAAAVLPLVLGLAGGLETPGWGWMYVGGGGWWGVGGRRP